MVADPDYRQGLSAEELVGTLQSLLAVERKTMRLTCRYLADLADAMEPAAGGLFGRDGAGGALAGYADVIHAAECLFGLGAHSTRERIRVGRALRSLPKIEGALVSGELSYSRAREVTRVATPTDESTWLDLASTLPMRSLERRVVEATGTGTGTGKGSPPHTGGPARLRWSSPENVEVTLRLPAEVWALVKRAIEGARRASEAPLSEAEALAAVARDALDRQTTGTDASDPRHTVVLYECQSCTRTELDTGAGPLEIGAAAAATLGCGARVRDLRTEGRVVRRGGPLPKAIDRAVRLRDRHTCRVPGCHRRRYVDVHHLRFQSEGGEHSRSNCVCLCTTHHTLLHEGHLQIEGDAEGELKFYGAIGAPLSATGASQGGTGGAPGASGRGSVGAPGASQGGTGGATGASGRGTVGATGASQGGTGGATGASQGGTGTAAFGSRGRRAVGGGQEAAMLLALMGGRGGVVAGCARRRERVAGGRRAGRLVGSGARGVRVLRCIRHLRAVARGLSAPGLIERARRANRSWGAVHRTRPLWARAARTEWGSARPRRRSVAGRSLARRTSGQVRIAVGDDGFAAVSLALLCRTRTWLW